MAIRIEGTYLEGCCGGECSCNAERVELVPVYSFEVLRDRLWALCDRIESLMQPEDEWTEMIWNLYDAADGCLSVEAFRFAQDIMDMIDYEINLAEDPYNDLD